MKSGPFGVELKILQNDLHPLCSFEISDLVISFKIRNWNKLPRSQKTHNFNCSTIWLDSFVRPLVKNE